MYNLGVCLFKGHGVAENKEEALEYLFKAAHREQLDAQYFVGLCFKKGTAGLQRDTRMAWRWFRRAAEQGHTSAGAAWRKLRAAAAAAAVESQLRRLAV
jgi:TPR repeat protein